MRPAACGESSVTENPGMKVFSSPGLPFGRRRYLSLGERLLSPAAQENTVLRWSAAASTGRSFPHADIRIAAIRWTLPYAFRPLCSRADKSGSVLGADGMRQSACAWISERGRGRNTALRCRFSAPRFPLFGGKARHGQRMASGFSPRYLDVPFSPSRGEWALPSRTGGSEKG